MALFPPLTNPNPRITIYQKCLFHDNTGPYYCCWHEEMNPKSNWLVYLFLLIQKAIKNLALFRNKRFMFDEMT